MSELHPSAQRPQLVIVSQCPVGTARADLTDINAASEMKAGATAMKIT
jgi:hypothetical protein